MAPAQVSDVVYIVHSERKNNTTYGTNQERKKPTGILGKREGRRYHIASHSADYLLDSGEASHGSKW